MLKDNVINLMQQRNWRQKDLARAAGLSEPGVSHIVNGKRTKPDYETLVKLSSAFGVSVEELMSS